jgi:hypothetical protein
LSLVEALEEVKPPGQHRPKLIKNQCRTHV